FLDIYGAIVNTSGIVIDTFSVSTPPEFQGYPALALGSANQVLITYQGWTDTVMSKVYNTMRIWGKFVPAPGIEESKVTTDLNSPIFMNSPNPFNRSTAIKYSVRKSGEVSIKIYDIAGKLVRNLVNDNKKPGTYSIRWNGTDDSGRKLPAGVYFYCLKTSNVTSETKELVILR
ncbi:MAG: T9SS type A sorting domain-containing protein, partial [candidate division WOR-3 bacterium]|nr:T9SS type A sorting domain-containing protein [candidate division WOR-3 bacterium]